jgi:DNA-binding CsgD family transcriptional regulator
VQVVLSRKEANTLLEIIDAGLRSRSEKDLRQLVRSLQELVPFEFALCAFSGTSYSSVEPYRIMNVSYPVPWLELYISKQFDKIDPIIAEHRLSFDLQYWADSYEKHKVHKEFVACAEDHGLKAGYSYGLKTESGDTASLFSFAGRSMERSRRTFLILRRIVPHLHQALVRIVNPLHRIPQVTYPKLSPREREVLRWIKEGKTTSEISSILTISERTVKFHVRDILRKVHASTRAQAVAISLEKGLIDID